MSVDKIITFPGGEELPENPVTLINSGKPYSFCKHERISLDEHKRTVDCMDCGIVLDPFGFLRHQAETLQRAWSNYRSVTAKVQELNGSIERLNKELASVQGKLRRAKEKVPLIDVRGKDRQ